MGKVGWDAFPIKDRSMSSVSETKKDPYRKLEVIQGEGPTLCIDCVFARSEGGGVWNHPKNFESGKALKRHLTYPTLWRCVGTPQKDVDFVTGRIDMDKVPTCKKQNDGECPWFSEYLEPQEPAELATTKKKPWWKFW
jgi:hypothetical protein